MLTVVAVTDVTPSVRRVVLVRHRRRPWRPPARPSTCWSRGWATPSRGWPRVAKDGRIVWPDGAHGVSLRSYTARRQDPAAGEVEIDFVLHGDGPAAAWAAAAAPGALLGVAGAGSLGERPAAHLLLAGDETALPAISRHPRRGRPPRPAGVALLEVAGPAEEQPLAAPGGVAVRWLHRGGDAARGEHAARRRRRRAGPARRGRRLRVGRPPSRPPSAAIRADLRGRWGLGRAQHHAIGYWRRGRAMSPAG